MNNPTPRASRVRAVGFPDQATNSRSRRVRFEEVTPAHEYAAFLTVSIAPLVAHLGLPIFDGYDDLDDLQLAFLTLPSGETVTLGEYAGAPGTSIYVEAVMQNIPQIVFDSCQQLRVSRQEVEWFHPDWQAEIERLYAAHGGIEGIERSSKVEELPQSNESEPIDCFYYALEIYTREKLPEYWAMLQHNLGLAYFDRSKGERWENLQKSIECYHKSLEIFTQDKFPSKWQINQEDSIKSLEAFPNLKLTIEFNDPELEPEQRDEQAQFLIDELMDMDKIDTLGRVLDSTPFPLGTWASNGFLAGALMAEVKLDNVKKLFSYLRERLDGKSIEFTVEINGKKLTVKARSREEFDYAIAKANDFIEIN
jgi:hypothetical protein